jgi:two-component system, chemotaxis family, response regulator PixG
MLTPSFVNSIEPPITTQKVFTPNYLAKQIQDCNKEQFTGRLDLNFKNPHGQQWCLIFRRGDLIWCASEVHPIRRWCRQLSLHCPQLTLDSEGPAPDSFSFKDADGSNVASTNSYGTASPPLTLTDHSGTKGSPQGSAVGQGSVLLPCWDYDSLAELIKQGKVQQGQVAAVLTGNITEILFDIHQQWERVGYNCELQLTYRSIPKNTIDLIDSKLVPIRTDLVWQQAIQAWKAWQQAALIDYSPNLAPTIWQPKKLRQHTSPTVYRNLTDLVNGNQTLRDLAVKLKQNLLPLTQSIVPYIREGWIGLIEVEDFSYSIKPATATAPLRSAVSPPVSPVQLQPTSPLVVCIDDSRIDSLAMNHILTQAGYRCINVQDPVQALPILLENKPDLIFLDLVMPVANGYEICAQIRRISAFKDTPVIILTSNDGIVDRVRAKMVGSSGFLAKPVDGEKVLKILQRYLGTSTLIPSQKLQTVQD